MCQCSYPFIFQENGKPLVKNMMKLLAACGWQQVWRAQWETMYCKLYITSNEISLNIHKNYIIFRTLHLNYDFFFTTCFTTWYTPMITLTLIFSRSIHLLPYLAVDSMDKDGKCVENEMSFDLKWIADNLSNKL